MSKKLLFLIIGFVISAAIFSVAQPVSAVTSVGVSSPNGGEVWEKGRTYTIKWNQAGIDKVTIWLMSGSYSSTCESVIVTNYLVNSSDTVGTYDFTIPFYLPDRNDYKIQILAYPGGVGYYSGNFFSITTSPISSSGTIENVSIGGYSFKPGDILTITWTMSGIVGPSSPVEIWLYQVVDRKLLIKDKNISTLGLNRYNWTVPTSVVPGYRYAIRITSVEYPVIFAEGGEYTILSTSVPGIIPSPSPSPTIIEGSLIRAKGDIDVWIVKYVGVKKFKRLILSPSVFNSYGHLKWGDIKDVDKSVVDLFVTSDLVRAVNDAKVFKLTPSGDSGQRSWIKTANAFTGRGFDWDAIYEINQVDRDSYIEGQVLE